MNLKSIVLTGKKKTKLLQKNIDINLKNKKVLVKIMYSGICRSQLMEIDMKRGEDRFLPHMLGHEAVGIVEKIGKDISKVKKGDKVVLSWIKGKGFSSQGDYFVIDNKKVNYGPISTFSTFSIVSEDRCFKVNKNFPNDIGVFFGCSILTGFGMVYNHFKIKKNDHILLVGLGGIGISALLGLKSKKIKNVIVLENNKKKYKLIREIGYQNIFKSDDKNLKNKINEITKGKFIDYCIEAAGSVKTISLGFDLLNSKGKIVFASHPESNQKIYIDPHDLIKGKQIIGSWGGNSKPDKDILKFYRILRNKNLLRFLKGKIYPINKYLKAIKDFRDGRVLRPILKM